MRNLEIRENIPENLKAKNITNYKFHNSNILEIFVIGFVPEKYFIC
jgi:hypothetical protein